jgi:hypothetical protein
VLSKEIKLKPLKIKVMNIQNTSLFTSISKAATKKLTAVVNETLAFNVIQTKAFTAADLWNIQRQRKSSLQRRHYA